jgi:hypothetical protein
VSTKTAIPASTLSSTPKSTAPTTVRIYQYPWQSEDGNKSSVDSLKAIFEKKTTIDPSKKSIFG